MKLSAIAKGFFSLVLMAESLLSYRRAEEKFAQQSFIALAPSPLKDQQSQSCRPD
jgi:hypothetical protein